MRFGICSNLVATGPDKTGVEIVETIAGIGYDYIELPLAEMMALSVEEFAFLRKRVADSGIRCESCNNFFPAHIRLTGPDVDMTRIEVYAEAALAVASSLGASRIVFGSAGAKNVPDGFDHTVAWQQLVEITTMLAPIAQRNNLVLCIEPIRKQECNIINTFVEGVNMAKQINHPNVKVLVDLYHMIFEHESPDVLVEHGREWLRHVHFCNPNLGSDIGRIYPKSIDEYDYAPFIDALKAINYEERVSLEASAPNFETDAKDALVFLRKYLG